MMRYSIIYTKEAEQDLVDIFEYIAINLLVPETAKKQTKRIMHAIEGLSEMPQRHKLFEDEPWHSKGIRTLPVDNYLVFYLALEVGNTVAIVRIMYGGRNIDQQLSTTKNI